MQGTTHRGFSVGLRHFFGGYSAKRQPAPPDRLQLQPVQNAVPIRVGIHDRQLLRPDPAKARRHIKPPGCCRHRRRIQNEVPDLTAAGVGKQLPVQRRANALSTAALPDKKLLQYTAAILFNQRPNGTDQLSVLGRHPKLSAAGAIRPGYIQQIRLLRKGQVNLGHPVLNL